MGALVPFSFEGRTLRSLDRNGDPWFVAGDAAPFLGYEHTPHLTRLLDADEKGVHTVDTLGGKQDVSVISEPGLYKAIAQRRATSALPIETRELIARFQRWLFHEVLPTIRRTGSYAMPAAQPAAVPALPNFADPAAAARAWAEQYEARIEAEQKRAETERTKAQIGSRREAVAMNAASQAAKQVKHLQIELDQSRQYATIKLMEAHHRGREFDWRLLKRISQEKGLLPVEVPDVNYGKVNSYHAEVWRAAYTLEIPTVVLQ